MKTQKTKTFRSLTVTLVIAFLTLSFFVLTVSTVFELYFSFQSQRDSIIIEQRLIAEKTASTVKAFVLDKMNVLDQAAEINSLAAAPERRALTLGKLLGRTPAFRQLFLVDATGQELQKASRLSVLAPSPLDEWRTLLLAEVLNGKGYTSPVYIDTDTGEPLMLVAVPANDAFHEPAGALIVEINLKFMWDVVEGITIGKEGLAYVIDRGGNLLAFRDSSRVLNHESVASLKEPNQFILGIHDPGADISRGILGTYVVSGHTSLGSPDWAVVVELPVMEAYASVLRMFGYSFLILFICSLLAVASGVYVSRHITRELLHLNAAAAAISQGDLDTKIEILSNNEIGQLGQSFNTMIGKLKELYAGMEATVAARTSELSGKLAEHEKLNKLMVDRELKMIALKKEIAALKTKQE